MKIVLIEDEIPAIEKLERYLLKYDPTFEIVIKLSSIAGAVEWFKDGENAFDLIFMDIQLSDGLSFEIFNQVSLEKPVIFITAFDEYAIDAFKVNSVDYILKPVTFTDLSKSLQKHKKLQAVYHIDQAIKKVSNTLFEKKVKDRFLVRLGNHIHAINAIDIALFYAEGRTVFLVTKEQKKFIVEYSLEKLCELLDSALFYRVNRTFIIQINAINNVVVYSNSRLKIMPLVRMEKEIIVSREKVSSFKRWLEGS